MNLSTQKEISSHWSGEEAKKTNNEQTLAKWD